MRQIVAVFLAVLLASPAAAQPTIHSLKETVLNIPAGLPVEVRLNDNAKLRGRLGAVSDTGFELQIVKNGKVDTVQVAFDQLRSIKTRVHANGYLIAGIVVVVIAVVAILAANSSNS